MLRIPHFLDNQLTDGGAVVSLVRRPPFTPQEDPHAPHRNYERIKFEDRYHSVQAFVYLFAIFSRQIKNIYCAVHLSQTGETINAYRILVGKIFCNVNTWKMADVIHKWRVGFGIRMHFLLLSEYKLKVLNLVKNLKPYMTQMSDYNLII
jgi:hypothetical protein